MDAARLDYPPVVDVRASKKKCGNGTDSESAAKGSVLEAAKYATKATALMELGTAITEFHFQLRNRRLYALSKKLREYIKAGDITAAELLDDDAGLEDARVPDARAIARWFEDTSEYLITDLA